MPPYIGLALRWFLGCLFLSSAAAKFANPEAFKRTLRNYPGGGLWQRPGLWALVPVTETLVSASLLTGAHWRLSAIVAAGLLALFAIAVLWAIRRGRTGPCGCGGLILADSIGYGHVLLNAGLLIAAVALATSHKMPAAVPEVPTMMFESENSGIDSPSILAIFTASTLIVLMASLKELRSVRERLRIYDIAAASGE